MSIVYRYLINSGRNSSQVLVGTGHSELDLVTDALLWAFCRVHCRDAEERQAEQPNPKGIKKVHLKGKQHSLTLLVIPHMSN